MFTDGPAPIWRISTAMEIWISFVENFSFTYFQNIGQRQSPVLASGRRLNDPDGAALKMDLQMITPTAVDWDGDGDGFGRGG